VVRPSPTRHATQLAIEINASSVSPANSTQRTVFMNAAPGGG
jgi:hypothetical protein